MDQETTVATRSTASDETQKPKRRNHVRTRNLPPRKVPCKFLRSGECRRGAECWFLHDEPVRSVPTEDFHNGLEGEHDNEDECCGICMSRPAVYGLLLNCKHVFCADCIREWRATEGFATVIVSTDGTTRSNEYIWRPGRSKHTRMLNKCCPYCRKLSDYIVPSSRMPVSDADKQAIITGYLRTLRHIPCKYGPSKCLFGYNCLYGHSAKADEPDRK
ncbi:hypothetical protein V1512DRAFT_261395 [Lipomyces arxii]|uniref:uncharacterized protein n=1 Tax=Lipomyces arxii TaxID=56418 RepID=UPI0034CF4494